MALIKFGGGVAAISGKDGGTVYARNRAGAYMRNWAKPTNAPSPSQALNRLRFANQSVAFSGLSKAVQDDWNGLANTITRRNRLGDDYVPTGRQLFLEINNALTANGQSGTNAPPADLVPPVLSETISIIAEEDSGDLDLMTLTTAGVDATFVYVVEATPPLGNTKNNVTLLYRTIGSFAGAAGPVDILASYTAVFGPTGNPDQLIMFRVRALKVSNGIFSPALVLPVTVVTGV